MGMKRIDDRDYIDLRPMQAELDFIPYPEGSVLFSMGNTRVLCNVSIEKGVPHWMQLQDVPGGWITAEYAMLPRATHTRSPRESIKPKARSQEIRRLVGRSLRAAVKLENLPEMTCIVDCDVLQADGGTRTASVSGGYIALALALSRLEKEGGSPLDIYRPAIAAVSAGAVGGELMLDLAYKEDAAADFDLNVVMNAHHSLIEVQGTAEAGIIGHANFVELLSSAETGVEQILAFQRESLIGLDVRLPDDVWGL